MKPVFIVANWKSNKTSAEAKEWLQQLLSNIYDLRSENKEIILCPSFTLLSDAKSYIIDHELPINLGAQDISPFGEGAYTGEVNGVQIKDYAEYVIIGHSERRINFKEDDLLLEKKIKRALESKLTPIFCVQDALTPIPEGVTIVAYEPLFAIGTGKSDSPESANKVAEEIKAKNPDAQHVLYGGSVTAENIKKFGSMESLSGVLVGKASLNPVEFAKIVNSF